MKRCPTCQRTYEDTQTFCVEDGAVLIAEYGSADFGGTAYGGGRETGPQREPPPTIYAPPGSLFPAGDYVAPEPGPSREPSDPKRPYAPPPTPGGYTPGNWQDSPSNPGGYDQTMPYNPSGPQSYNPPAPQSYNPPPVPQGYGAPPMPNYAPPSTPMTAPDQSMALISLVCGVLSMFCFGLLAGIPAIITGKIARDRVAQDPSRYTGAGLALAGMILGGISTALSLLWLLFMIISAVAGAR